MEEMQDRLELDSTLDEVSRGQAWVEAVAERQGLGEDTRFAIRLCMEEALANVILHGYRSEPGHPIVIQSSVSEDRLFFSIEDNAPPFTPDEPGSATDPTPPNLETVRPGGNGIRLLRHFAGSLSYERLPHGNRLTIGFPAHPTKPLS
jgi:anti-sigma regulatory factor (Ser/Thr protein kinase)